MPAGEDALAFHLILVEGALEMLPVGQYQPSLTFLLVCSELTFIKLSNTLVTQPVLVDIFEVLVVEVTCEGHRAFVVEEAVAMEKIVL